MRWVRFCVGFAGWCDSRKATIRRQCGGVTGEEHEGRGFGVGVGIDLMILRGDFGLLRIQHEFKVSIIRLGIVGGLKAFLEAVF